MRTMMEDLAEVEQNDGGDVLYSAGRSLRFIRTHHAEIAQNAEDSKRLKALEQAINESDVTGWKLSELYGRADEIMRGG